MAQENEVKSSMGEGEIDLGSVKIADEVVTMIAGFAAQEVEGVYEMAGNNTSGLFSKSEIKKATKGVRVDVADGNVRVDLAIVLAYGYNIPSTSSKIQARVKSAIENMTGLVVTNINVRVAGIKMAPDEEEAQ